MCQVPSTDGKEVFTEGVGILHELVPGTNTESAVILSQASLSKRDNQVLIQGSLASQIATEQVKCESKEVLGAVSVLAHTWVTGTVTCVCLTGEEEHDSVGLLLLGREPQDKAHFSYFRLLPLVKDNVTSAVILQVLSKITDGVIEAGLGVVYEEHLNGWKELGRLEKNLLDLFCE